MGDDAVSLEALAEAVKGQGEDIRDLRRTQEADSREWRAAHDKLRENIAEEMRRDRQLHADDMREVRGMVATGLQAVRDDQQEGNRQIDSHLSQQDAELAEIRKQAAERRERTEDRREARRGIWIYVVGGSIAGGIVTLAITALTHAFGL